MSLAEQRSLHAIARTVAERIADRTAGNPLAIEEAVRLLSAQELSGAHPLPNPLPIGPGGRASMTTLITSLQPRTRDALLVAALAGDAARLLLPPTLRILGLDLADLDEAVVRETIFEQNWALRHPLLASAVYDVSHPALVRATHTALARTCRGVDIPRWAHHLAAAAGGIDAAAAEAMELAADLESRRGGLAASATLWQPSVELSPPGSHRIARQLTAVEALTAAGQRPTAMQYLSDLSAARLSTEQLTRATYARSRLLVWSSDVAHEIGVIYEAVNAPAAKDNSAAADASLNLATAGFAIGAVDLILSQAARAIELTAEHPARNAVAQMFNGFALALFRGIPWEPDITSLDDPEVRSYLTLEMPLMCAGLAQGLIWLERPALSDALRLPLIEHARRTGAAASLPYPLTSGGELSWWAGNWEEGKRDLAEAVELGELVGQHGLLGFSNALQALYAAAQGDQRQLSITLARTDGYIDGLGVNPVALYAGRARLHDALAQRRLSDALEIGKRTHDLAEVIGVVGVIHVPYLPEYAEAAVRAAAPEAPDLIARLDDRARNSEAPWINSVTRRVKGLAAGTTAEAEQHFDDALVILGAQKMPFEHARTLQCLGEYHAATGDSTAARTALQQALEVYTRLGAEPWRRTATAALRKLGERPTSPRVRPTSLSSQQRQVCELVAQGATNREAAAALFLSEKTIEYHVRMAMRKLNAANRTDLARVFTEQQSAARFFN